MKCSQCGSDEVGYDRSYRFSVKCENCLHQANLGRYVAEMSGGLFGITEDVGYTNGYKVVGSEGSIGSLIFDNFPKLNAKITAEKPSMADTLIASLYAVFGFELVVKVKQEGVDDRFKGCPVCAGTQFKRDNNQWTSVHCKEHYEVKIARLAESVILVETDLVVIHVDDWKFIVRYDRPAPVPFWQSPKIDSDLVAEVILRFGERKTVMAVRSLAHAGHTDQYNEVVRVLTEKIVLKNLEVIPIK